MTVAENTLVDRYAALGHVYQGGPASPLIGVALFPTILRSPVPRPPGLIVGLSIKNSGPGDSDILLLEGINERRIVHQLHAFPTAEYDRQVFGGVLTEFDRPAGSHVQIDVTF